MTNETAVADVNENVVKGKEKKKKFSLISIFKSSSDESAEIDLKRKKSSFKGNPPRYFY